MTLETSHVCSACPVGGGRGGWEESSSLQTGSVAGQMEERASYTSCQQTVLWRARTSTTGLLMGKLAGEVVKMIPYQHTTLHCSYRPLLFSVLKPPDSISLKCPPAFKYVIFSREGKWLKYLLRGDATGSICVWRVPDTPECAALQAKAEGAGECEKLAVVSTKSLSTSWNHASPHPVGVLDQLDENMNSAVVESSSTPALTSHIFLPSQCRLVIGREDGSIVMVPATQTIMLHLLSGRHHKYTTWPSHQVLIGNKELSKLNKITVLII